MSQQAYIAQIGGVPVLVLKEGTQRAFGKEALRINIMVAKAVSEVMRTTLGPKGMDKMLIDSLGDITITNDGATILNEMDVQHPIGKLLVEIAKTQDDEVGDGTTTAVVLAGALLDEAEKLIEKNIHPTVIISGFKKGLDAAIQYLTKIAIPVDRDNIDVLKKVAATSMHGKISETVKDQFAELAARAVSMIKEQRGDRWIADLDNVQLVKKHGGSLLDTQLIQGVVIDKEVVHAAMPKKITNAKIALLDAPLEVEKPEIDAEIRIQDPTQIKAFLDEEENILRGYVDKLKSIGANVIFTTKGIDDIAQYYLAKAGIMAVRRVKRSDIEKLAKATGARIATSIKDLKPEDLGTAGLVEERKVGEEKMVFVEQCPNPRAVTILIRGAADRVLDEAERSINDALHVTRDLFRDPRIVPGGGAFEIEVARRLREWGRKLPGKEQLAVMRYAEAVEKVPEILALTAGLDPVDAIAELRSRHDKGELDAGVDVLGGKITRMSELNIWDPLIVKMQVMRSATEAAIMVLRIDDIIAAGQTKSGSTGKGKAGEESKTGEESGTSSD